MWEFHVGSPMLSLASADLSRKDSHEANLHCSRATVCFRVPLLAE